MKEKNLTADVVSHPCGMLSKMLNLRLVSTGDFASFGSESGDRRGLPSYVAAWGVGVYLLMPHLLIFDSRVCRGMLSLAAAPEGPEMRPWHSAKALLIISTS